MYMFLQELTNIVRRDFFPDLEKLEKEVRDEVGGNMDPTGGDKPVLRLDQFLNQYESEDDASFANVLEKESELHHQKHSWLHKQEEQSRLSAQKKLAIAESAESQGTNRRAGLDSWTYTAKNSLMYVPEGVESSAVESIQESNRTRKIVHSNTRLPEQFIHKYQHDSHCESRKPAQEKVGVDGKVLAVDESPKVNGYGFLSTPQIKPGNTYSIVSFELEFQYQHYTGVDASPLMTWGSIEGTPVRIDSDSIPLIAGGPSFKMPKVPTREKIALKLADQVAKTSRERRKKSSAASRFVSIMKCLNLMFMLLYGYAAL